MTKVSKRAIFEDLQRAIPEHEILANHGLTRSQLKIVRNALVCDGILPGNAVCPACGFAQDGEFAECPRCGVVVGRYAPAVQGGEGVWTRVWRGAWRWVERAWDWVDCGLYRVFRHYQAKWGAWRL